MISIAWDPEQLGPQLANARLADAAVQVMQALVELLVGFVPAEPERLLDRHIRLAEARHNLIARLIDTGQIEQAGTLCDTRLGRTHPAASWCRSNHRKRKCAASTG